MVKTKNELSRKDWIDAAMNKLFESGIGAVKVDRLAVQLGISRGSFYWHFKDLDDLLFAMIEYWLITQRDNLSRAKNSSSNGQDRLKAIIDHIRQKNSRHDVAMRLWAYQNGDAAAAVRKIDSLRIKLLEQTFSEVGFVQEEARFRAYVLYNFQIGDQLSQKPPTSSDRKSHFSMLNSMLTGKVRLSR